MINIEQLADNGELFDDKYKLIRPLNTDGGTADVWLALDADTVKDKKVLDAAPRLEDSYLDRIGLLVAIKIYRPQNALDIEGEQKFRDEYTIVYNCYHTNLIHPTNYSIYKETPYLVLPYCKNGSSELLIGNLTQEEEIWKYIYDVASGLSYLHCCNPPIIHQDIKPGNVLLNNDGRYAITDFGISVKYDDNQDNLDEENSGTLAYMAPERFNLDIEPSTESDIWAFGATLCELITGNVPFGENGGEAQVNGVKMTTLPKELSRGIKDIISRCLNQDANKRPIAKQLANEASEHLQGKSKKNHYWIWGLLLLGAFSAYFFLHNEPPEKREHKEIIDEENVVMNHTYMDALKMLKSTMTSEEGLNILDSLSNKGDANASYLLSRLYFVSNLQSDNDAVEDTIKVYKKYIDNSIIKSRCHLSHNFLQTCINQDSMNYYALYLLGLDYLGGNTRQNGVTRDIKLAKECFLRALNKAQEDGNESFVSKVQEKINNF